MSNTDENVEKYRITDPAYHKKLDIIERKNGGMTVIVKDVRSVDTISQQRRKKAMGYAYRPKKKAKRGKKTRK